MEDYLEAIAILTKEKGTVRVKDISSLMKVKNPSVTGALATLERDSLVKHERYGYVELTRKGERIADDIQKRHILLVRFLTLILKRDDQTVEKEACRIEHAISTETFERLSKFIEFVEICPEEQTPPWLSHFYHFMKTGEMPECSHSFSGKKKESV
jgi:DtxR family Mn-dependent transcriptional regulator